MSHANRAFRTKAEIQRAALAGLDPEIITQIVRNASLRARGGSPKEVASLLKLVQILGIGKINPDRANKDEISALMGSPTDGLMKRIRPATKPGLIEEVG